MSEQTVGVRLDEEYLAMLDEVRWQLKGENRSDTIRKLIDAEAKRQGISIGTNGVVIADKCK